LLLLQIYTMDCTMILIGVMDCNWEIFQRLGTLEELHFAIELNLNVGVIPPVWTMR